MLVYDEMYLSGAQQRLGGMIDFATNGCGIQLDEFYQSFLEHPVSVRFGAGDVAIVAGRSGEELVFEVLRESGAATMAARRRDFTGGATAEYWTGWALAFYQWASGLSFSEIEQCVPIGDVRSLYSPYHEMDVRQFCERMDALVGKVHQKTALQRRRLDAGLSQRELAIASGVPVRTLQQYEQRQKDVNHARADYIISLARVLCCEPADLMEHNARSRIEYAVVSF